MKTWIRLIIFDLILNAAYVIFILVCIFIVRAHAHAENYVLVPNLRLGNAGRQKLSGLP